VLEFRKALLPILQNRLLRQQRKLKVDYNSDWVVVKAQIHAGGRGKGGGVKLAKI
jgi:succinyl-CoA synthetase beta subunit